MHGLSHAALGAKSLGLDLAALGGLVAIGLEGDVDAGDGGGGGGEGGVGGEEGGDVGEGVRVRGVVGEQQDVAGVEFGGVVQDGGFELAELFEDERALLAAGELDAVDRRARFDGRVVGGRKGAGEEGVEEGGFAGAGAAEDVGEEDGAFDAGGVAAGTALAGFCEFEGGGGGGWVRGGGFEAEVGEVGEGGFGRGEGGHAPLSQPALQGDVAGLVTDGRAGESGVEPGGGQSGGGGEEGRKFGGIEAAIVVCVGEEEEVDEEAVAGGGELGGRVRRNVKLGVEEGVAEGEGVRVVEGAENDPDGFVAAFLREDFVEEDEARLGNTFAGYRRRGALANGLLDVFEVAVSKRFAKAFCLEVLHFLVTQVAIVVSVRQVENSLQRCDTSRLQIRFLRVE